MSIIFREEQFACSRMLHRKHVGDDKGLASAEVRRSLVEKKVFDKKHYCSADVLQLCIDCGFVDWKGNVLDFGCRSAGLFQIMADVHPQCEYFGCDIRLACKGADWLEAIQTNPDPPLPYDPNFFTTITAFSVFSHLSLESMIAWLNELSRVLVKGGRLFFTYCGERTIETLSNRHNWSHEKTLDLVMQAHRDNFVWQDIYKQDLDLAGLEVKDLLVNHFAGSDHYGLTFIHDITKVCPPSLTIKAILPGRSGHQNVCVAEKS